MSALREMIEQCLLCGQAGAVLYPALGDRLETDATGFGLQRCAACHCVWLSPRPTREDLPSFYPSDYYAYGAPEVVGQRTGAVRGVRDTLRRLILSEALGYTQLGSRSRWASFIGALLGGIPSLRQRAAFGWGELCPSYVPHGRLLDVGCGAASYLARMRELGWEVQGVDLSHDAARVARERYGIPVEVGMLSEARFPDNRFAVITMSHVIEHVPDPLAYLAECRRILAPGGRLIVRTPNLGGFASWLFGKDWMALDPPRHLVLFTPATLRACVEQSGFRVLQERSDPAMASFNAQMSLFIGRQGHARGLMDVVNTGLLARAIGLIERALLPVWRWAGNELRLVAEKS